MTYVTDGCHSATKYCDGCYLRFRMFVLEPSKDARREDNPRERTMTYVTDGCRSATKYCDGYKTNMASPKLKKRYCSLTAMLYSSSVFSLPMNAETNIIKVLSGKWKLVISPFTI